MTPSDWLVLPFLIAAACLVPFPMLALAVWVLARIFGPPEAAPVHRTVDVDVVVEIDADASQAVAAVEDVERRLKAVRPLPPIDIPLLPPADLVDLAEQAPVSLDRFRHARRHHPGFRP